MNNTRIAIGIALLMMLSATAFVISDSDNTDAVTVDNIRYNSDLGFEIDVGDVAPGERLIVSILPQSSSGSITGWTERINGSGTATLTTPGSEISDTGSFGYSLRVQGEENVDDSIYILEILFDSNNDTGRTSSVFLSENYVGYELPDKSDLDWSSANGVLIGWSTDPDAEEPEYLGGEELGEFTRSMTEDDVMTLYAVYGDAPVTEDVIITVTGNGADVTADGLVDGTITAEVGTELTFDVQAQAGYTLEGATYTYNGHTIQIDGDSFTIEVVKGANTLVVDAEEEQPVEEPVTVNIDSTGARVTYNDAVVGNSLQLVPGTDATFGISAQTGYTMEGCTVTYNGDPVEVTDGEFTITVAENGGTIVIILQDVNPEPEVLDRIEVTGYRVQYQVGETFSTHGMSVTAVYKSGDTERRVSVDIADCDFQPGLDVPFDAVGPMTVTVIYDDGTDSVSCPIEVQVVPAPEPPCTITVTQPENGSITPSSGSVAVGNTFTYTVSADFGWRIVSVTANGETIDVDGVSYSGSFVVSADASVTAEIVSDATGTVTVTAGDHGSIGAGGATSVSVTVYGHWATTVTIDPDNGYRVSGISHDGAENSVTYEDGVLTIAAGSDVTKIDIAFEQIPVSDDDEEYVPPVITVIPGDDDDSTTYIVAIAAAAVVAILAALILMQTRKS